MRVTVSRDGRGVVLRWSEVAGAEGYRISWATPLGGFGEGLFSAWRADPGFVLNRAEYDQADALARQALELLQGREDYLHEVCPSQLVLGRALLERGRFDEAEDCFRAADAAAEQLASISDTASGNLLVAQMLGTGGRAPAGRVCCFTRSGFCRYDRLGVSQI